MTSDGPDHDRDVRWWRTLLETLAVEFLVPAGLVAICLAVAGAFLLFGETNVERALWCLGGMAIGGTFFVGGWDLVRKWNRSTVRERVLHCFATGLILATAIGIAAAIIAIRLLEERSASAVRLESNEPCFVSVSVSFDTAGSFSVPAVVQPRAPSKTQRGRAVHPRGLVPFVDRCGEARTFAASGVRHRRRAGGRRVISRRSICDQSVISRRCLRPRAACR